MIHAAHLPLLELAEDGLRWGVHLTREQGLFGEVVRSAIVWHDMMEDRIVFTLDGDVHGCIAGPHLREHVVRFGMPGAGICLGNAFRQGYEELLEERLFDWSRWTAAGELVRA